LINEKILRTHPQRYKGVIFDCDGVLVDSEALSCGAWNILFEREYNIDIGTDYSHILGKTTKEVVESFFKLHSLEYTPDILPKIAAMKERIYQESAHGKLKPTPGVKEFITKLIQHNIPIIVASSGILAKIQFNLKETGLSDYFSQIISADGIKNGKPHPEIFLLAAERLKIPINECIVIEDSVTGVSAGKASGAFTVAITTSFPAKKLNQADLVVKKFEEIPLDLLFR